MLKWALYVLPWLVKVLRDPIRLKKYDEDVLGYEIPYLSEIRSLLYLAQYTRLDLSFDVKL